MNRIRSRALPPPTLAHLRQRCSAARSAPHQSLAGALLLALLAWPGTRALLEASMWRHMVLQLPLLLLAGSLLAAALPAAARARLARWNAHGISGLLLVLLCLALWMVPRALDLALRDGWVETGKFALLTASGAALRLSWRAAGRIMQGFFLGNLLPMTYVVGQLYLDSPLRLCNAYLLDDQERLGRWLMSLAALSAAAWVARVFWLLARREEAAAPARQPGDS